MEAVAKEKKYLYPQDWHNYNLAQTNEKAHFLELLYILCSQIDDPPKEKKGRNPLSMSDMIFCVVYKIYSMVSGRRFMSDLAEAHRKGYIAHLPHFNSIFNYLEHEDMYFYLKQLITESASPLRAIEVNFAVDSSGFSTGQFTRWLRAKYGKTYYQERGEWLKCHLMCGISTNIVTSVEITERKSADCPQFEPLVEETARHFTINHVCADRAYISERNLEVVNNKGGMAFIPFKSNNRLETKTRKRNPVWKNMYYFFHLHREKFMQAYHKRSNVETTFSMIKGKFGERLRSKTQTAQVNEILCKILCHNICCVIHAMYELGIEADFYKEKGS